jgi:hypothetical protein
MIRIVILFEVLHVVFRVYSLTYFIYFRLESLLKRDFESSGFTKSFDI